MDRLVEGRLMVATRSLRNCFVNLPEKWGHRILERPHPRITVPDEPSISTYCFRLQWDDKTVVVAWAGGSSQSQTAQTDNSRHATEQDIIELDPAFAASLGLAPGDVVDACECTQDLQYRKQVFIEPVDPDDWEIIELNAHLVEEQFLNQIRVLWIGLKVPLFIHRSAVEIEVTQLGSDSDHADSASAVILGLDSEVFVAPKVREKEKETDSPECLPEGVTIESLDLRCIPASRTLTFGSTDIQSAVTRALDPAVIVCNFWCSELAAVPADCTPAIWLSKTGIADKVAQHHPCRLYHDASVPLGLAIVSAELLSTLGCEALDRVEINSINQRPQQSGRATLRPISSAEYVHTAANLAAWLASISSSLPQRIVDGGLVAIVSESGQSVGESTSLILYQTSLNDEGPNDGAQDTQQQDVKHFCALYDTCGVELVIGDCVPARLSLPGQIKQPTLCGAEKQIAELWSFIRASMTGVCSPHHHYSLGGALIVGPNGSGKTSLAQLVSMRAQRELLMHISMIDCADLAGKDMKSVRKRMRKAIHDATERQPSIIIWDGLDKLAKGTGGDSSSSLREDTMASLLIGLLSDQSVRGREVLNIATAKNRQQIHSKVIGSSSFKNLIQLDPPDSDTRLKILTTFLELADFSVTHESPWNDVLSRTEGYVGRDLMLLVNRTVSMALLRTKANKEGNPFLAQNGMGSQIFQDDFVAAIDSFTPSHLHGVKLQTVSKNLDDVGGMEEVKESLLETMLWPSKYPKLFAQSKLRMRSGTLLYGPPGTGKTMIAGAVASHCNLRFISIAGPELLSKYIGASEQSVRDTFARAQAAKPSVLFFDEFDSIAPQRGHDSTGVTDRVVNQLLTELDGVEGLEGVFVIAATSRPELIDAALLRPGRLDKAVYCGMPDLGDRTKILEVLLANIPLDQDVDLGELAKACDGYSAADLKGIVGSAQVELAHAVLEKVEQTDAAIDASSHTESESECKIYADAEADQAWISAIHDARQTVLESPLPQPNSSEAPSRLLVPLTQTMLLKAVSETRPSVQIEEIERYLKLRDKFSGKSTSTDPKSMKLKATLA